jgi:hypothetical protein
MEQDLKMEARLQYGRLTADMNGIPESDMSIDVGRIALGCEAQGTLNIKGPDVLDVA